VELAIKSTPTDYFFFQKIKNSQKKTNHLDFFKIFGQKHCFSANNAVVWGFLKMSTLLAVAMDPLNTLDRLNIALDEEKQGET
jgi:hypothetical protein